MKKYLVLSGMLVALCAEVSSANDFYIFGDYGRSNVSDGIISPIVSIQENRNTYQIGAGYQVNDHLSLEASYLNLGEIHATYTDGGASFIRYYPNGRDVRSTTELGIEFIGLTLGARGEFNLYKNVDMFARGGAFIWQSYANVNGGAAEIDGNAVSAGSHKFESGVAPYLGLGTEYHITPSLAANIQVNRYWIDHAEETTVGTSYTAGLLYDF